MKYNKLLLIILSAFFISFAAENPTTHILKPGLPIPNLGDVNVHTFDQYMQDARLPWGNSGLVPKLPYYLLSKAEVGVTGVDNWTSTEQTAITKALNYWNNSGAKVFIFNDGTWSSKYSPITYRYETTPGSVIGNLYPYGIIKVVSVIKDKDENPVWPINGEAGCTVPNWKYPNDGDPFANIWMILIDMRPPETAYNGYYYYQNKYVLDPTNIDEANNYRVQGLLNLPNNTEFANSATDPAIFKMGVSVCVIHEMGHALLSGSNNTDHDNTQYNCRKFTETTTPAGTFDFRDVFTKRYMCVTPWKWIDGGKTYTGSFNFSAPNQVQKYKYLEGGVVYTQTRTENQYGTEAGHGLAASSKYLPAYVWSATTETIDIASTYFWPYSVMATGDPRYPPIFNGGGNYSYSNFGCLSLLNSVTWGSNVAARHTWAAGYLAMGKVYGFFTITPREKKGSVYHE